MPLAAGAQQAGKVPRIGLLRPRLASRSPTHAFRQGLRDLGYVEGQPVVIEHRLGEGQARRGSPFSRRSWSGSKSTSSSRMGCARPPAPLKRATCDDPDRLDDRLRPRRTGLRGQPRPAGGECHRAALSARISAGKQLQLLKEAVPGRSLAWPSSGIRPAVGRSAAEDDGAGGRRRWD